MGTAARPIVFTSNAGSPAPGDWYSIGFMDTADNTATVLDHCIIEYGGGSSYGSLYSKNASPTIKNTIVRHGKGRDLYYSGAAGGSVSGCTFNSGVYLVSASGSVEFNGNTFIQNDSFPTTASVNSIHSLVNGNTFTNLNATSHLEVIGSPLSRDATWTAAIPLYLPGKLAVQGTDGDDQVTTLTLESGAVVKFGKNQWLAVGGSSGALSAVGMAAKPIVFTSNATSPAPGDWYGIDFMDTADRDRQFNQGLRVAARPAPGHD